MYFENTRWDKMTVTVVEAAKILGISRNAAYSAVHSGELPSFRIGRRILVSRLILDQILSNPSPRPEGGAESGTCADTVTRQSAGEQTESERS